MLRRERGTAILWATHLVEEIDQADRVVYIQQGQVVATGTPAELMRSTDTSSLTGAYLELSGPAAGGAAPGPAAS